MAKMIGLSGKAAAALVGTVVAVGGGSYIIKDEQGAPIIQSLLSSGSQTEAAKVDSKETSEEMASLPDVNSSTTAPEASGEEIKIEEPKDVEEEQIATQSPVLPTFDVMRVERDGSVVIAGKAPKNSEVEIVEGGEVLGSAKSNADGDFAIVFDTPLSVGDHELIIKAMPEEGEPIFSEEAGIVTIPKFENNQEEVLALVQKSGEASRILQGPTVASKEEAETPEQVEAPEEVASLDEDAAETSVAEESKPAPKPDTAKTTEPAEQEVSEDEPTENADEGVKEQVAQADEKPVLVQAIDVEPEKIFIAGQGEPNRSARVYIDGEFKGNVKIGPQGTFLFELNEGLESGTHDLRVDLLADGSAEVASRAAVTIDHQPEPVAVASAEPEQVNKMAQEQLSAEPEPEASNPVDTESKTPAIKQAEVPQEQKEAMPTSENSKTAASSESSDEQKEESAQVTVAEQKPDAEDVETKTAEVTEPVASETNNEQIQTADAKPVIQTGRSVIIRRGDNLWRISRRMLGAGRKYTLIFSANSNQIKDPNRIYPGQVFDVPDEEVVAEGQKNAG